MVLRYFGAIGRRWPEQGNVRGRKANRGVDTPFRIRMYLSLMALANSASLAWISL